MTTTYIARRVNTRGNVTHLDSPSRDTIDEARADAMQSLYDLTARERTGVTAQVVEYDRDEDGDLHHRRVVESVRL